MQLPAENLGQHPAGSEYAINASSGSPHNALNPRRFTPENGTGQLPPWRSFTARVFWSVSRSDLPIKV